MLDGFNEGWIDFERGAAEHRTGTVTLDTVPRELVEKAGAGDGSRPGMDGLG